MKNEAKEKEERPQRRSKEGRKLPSTKKEREQAAPSDFSESDKLSVFPFFHFFNFILNGTGTGGFYTGSTAQAGWQV